MRISSLLVLLALALVAPPTRAQFSQYTPPGSLAEPTVSNSDRIPEESEKARWRLGSIRADPRLWIFNSGYRDNVFSEPEGGEKQSDVTATIGMGLVFFAHLGPKVIASAHLLPEYVWWQDLEELRSLNGAYGVELVGLFNRLTVETEIHTRQRESLLSSELEIPVTGENEGASASFRVDLGNRLEAFASMAEAEIKSALEDPSAAPDVDLSTLDRHESVYTGGIAYDITDALEVSAGIQRRKTDFDNDFAARDNTGTSPLVGLDVSLERFQLALTLVDRELDFGPNSALGSSTSAVGRMRAAWMLTPRTDLAIYGGRNIIYSTTNAESIYLESRYGAAIESSFADRFHLRLFAETGNNDFAAVDPTAGDRTDDVNAWGFGFGSAIFNRLGLRIGLTRSEVDSPLPEVSRAVNSIIVNLDLAGERLFRRPRP